MGAKTSGWKFDEGQNIHVASKYLPTKYLLIPETKSFEMEKNLLDTILAKWPKLPVMVQNDITCAFWYWEHSTTYMEILQKMHNQIS